MTIAVKEYIICQNLHIVDMPGISTHTNEYITKIDKGKK